LKIVFHDYSPKLKKLQWLELVLVAARKRFLDARAPTNGVAQQL